MWAAPSHPGPSHTGSPSHPGRLPQAAHAGSCPRAFPVYQLVRMALTGRARPSECPRRRSLQRDGVCPQRRRDQCRRAGRHSSHAPPCGAAGSPRFRSWRSRDAPKVATPFIASTDARHLSQARSPRALPCCTIISCQLCACPGRKKPHVCHGASATARRPSYSLRAPPWGKSPGLAVDKMWVGAAAPTLCPLPSKERAPQRQMNRHSPPSALFCLWTCPAAPAAGDEPAAVLKISTMQLCSKPSGGPPDRPTLEPRARPKRCEPTTAVRPRPSLKHCRPPCNADGAGRC